MTEAVLVAAAAAGDRDAAGTLLHRYYPECWRFAYRMMGNTHDAEDVVQDTFLRVVRSLSTCRQRDRFRSWLFRILVNTCRTALRQRHRRAKRFFSSSDDNNYDIAERPIANVPPASEMSEPERQEALATAIQAALLRLEAKQREAFLLKYSEGMEYTEMTVVTGAGVSALKMRVKRACEALRPLLGETHDLVTTGDDHRRDAAWAWLVNVGQNVPILSPAAVAHAMQATVHGPGPWITVWSAARSGLGGVLAASIGIGLFLGGDWFLKSGEAPMRASPTRPVLLKSGEVPMRASPMRASPMKASPTRPAGAIVEPSDSVSEGPCQQAELPSKGGSADVGAVFGTNDASTRVHAQLPIQARDHQRPN